MIGKAKPRDLAVGALCPGHKGVQKNFNTGVPANLVENQLDRFGIEDQKDAAMPLRRRDGAHRAELGNDVVGYAPHGLPRLLLQRIDPAIGQHTTRGRCTAKAARRLDQRHPGARLCRADGGSDAGGATADYHDVIFSKSGVDRRTTKAKYLIGHEGILSQLTSCWSPHSVGDVVLPNNRLPVRHVLRQQCTELDRRIPDSVQQYETAVLHELSVGWWVRVCDKRSGFRNTTQPASLRPFNGRNALQQKTE